jgi:predicted RNA binding protein YcfA (HicA-like mRNA interferase family)
MSSKQKLIARLKSKPRDFKWKEVVTLCSSLGFVEIQGNGSRVKFYNEKLDLALFFHRPHPSNIVKEYVVRQLLKSLEEKELI